MSFVMRSVAAGFSPPLVVSMTQRPGEVFPPGATRPAVAAVSRRRERSALTGRPGGLPRRFPVPMGHLGRAARALPYHGIIARHLIHALIQFPNMADTEEIKQPDEREATKDEGCPVEMYGGRLCGRPIYNPPPGVDETPVCLMHSHDPNKDDAAFQAEFERILKEAADGVANFSKLVFPTANHICREFRAECVFTEATFTRGAIFSEGTFNRGANFCGATFTEVASFYNATFLENAIFIGATFTRRAEFRGASFKRHANFSETKFQHEADFSRATFSEVAGFRSAEFEGTAQFRETQFREDEHLQPGPIFTLARFERPDTVIFHKTYLGQALLHLCDVSRVGFSDVRWRKRTSNSKWMVFEQELSLDHPSAWALKPGPDNSDDRNYGLIAELYQQLKKNYDDRRDYWMAGDFHYGEMEMKRLACPRLTWLSWLQAKLSGNPRFRKLGEWCGKLQSNAWLLSKVRWWHQRFGLAAWYRRASDYGESWGKPLLWLVAVLLVFATVYPAVGLRSAMSKSQAVQADVAQSQTQTVPSANLTYWNSSQRARLFGNSVMTSLGVAAFQRDLAYEPSYPWGRVLALLELLLTSTLIALFLLAVRREFRR
jgi:uncharacterized protein YjbI with pentapeptide repeats